MNFFVLFSVLETAPRLLEGASDCWPWNPWSGFNFEKLNFFLYLLLLCTTYYFLLILEYSVRAAAFFAAPELCYFSASLHVLRVLCVCSACRACETLKNATLDAAIAVDTAENEFLKV